MLGRVSGSPVKTPSRQGSGAAKNMTTYSMGSASIFGIVNMVALIKMLKTVFV